MRLPLHRCLTGIALLLLTLLLVAPMPALAHGAPLQVHVTMNPAGPKAGQPAMVDVTVQDALGAAVPDLPVSIKVQTEQGRTKQRVTLAQASTGLYRGTVNLPTPGTWVLEIDMNYLDDLQTTFINTVAGETGAIAGAQHEWDTMTIMTPLPPARWPYITLFSILGLAVLGIIFALVRSYTRNQ